MFAIRIFDGPGCDLRIENSVMKITVQYHRPTSRTENATDANYCYLVHNVKMLKIAKGHNVTKFFIEFVQNLTR